MARFSSSFARPSLSCVCALAMGLLLSGCMGGPIAGQIAQSLAMRVLDRATSDAYEAHLLKDDPPESVTLKDTEPDEYWASFVTSGFNTVEPVAEALPDYRQAEYQAQGNDSTTTSAPPQTVSADSHASLEQTRLVRVELWNLLVGSEKQSLLEKARLIGATSLPPAEEWPRWQVATGSMTENSHKPITFLIPPDFGRVRSGDYAVVELAGAGEVNVARYAVGH